MSDSGGFGSGAFSGTCWIRPSGQCALDSTSHSARAGAAVRGRAHACEVFGFVEGSSELASDGG